MKFEEYYEKEKTELGAGLNILIFLFSIGYVIYFAHIQNYYQVITSGLPTIYIITVMSITGIIFAIQTVKLTLFCLSTREYIKKEENKNIIKGLNNIWLSDFETEESKKILVRHFNIGLYITFLILPFSVAKNHKDTGALIDSQIMMGVMPFFITSIITISTILVYLKIKFSEIKVKKEEEKTDIKVELKEFGTQLKMELQQIKDEKKKEKRDAFMFELESIENTAKILLENKELLDTDEKHMIKRILEEETVNILKEYNQLLDNDKEAYKNEVKAIFNDMNDALKDILEVVQIKKNKNMDRIINIMKNRYRKV